MRAAGKLWAFAIGGLALAVGHPGLALDPQRSLTQLHHRAWTIADGAPPDIWALAQSRDGYLWLGTGAGLYRFDGVRFDKFRPLAGDRMPSANINALRAASNGDLWIGYNTGEISRLRGGRLTNFNLGKRGIPVIQIAEDKRGAVWAAIKSRSGGGLARYRDGRWSMVGAAWGLPDGGVSGVLPAADGSLWAAAGDAIWVLRPGAKRFERTGERAFDRTRIVQAPDSRIWISPGGNLPIHPVVNRLQPGASKGRPGRTRSLLLEGSGEHILVDRDNVLWGTRRSGGIFRLVDPIERSRSDIEPGEQFTLADGLSSDLANPLIEDREGNIWVGTNLGLDRFRQANAVAAPGLPKTSRLGFLAVPGADGAVYVTTGDALFLAFPDRPAVWISAVADVPWSLHVDRSRTLWLGTDHGAFYLEERASRPVASPGLPAGPVAGWVEDGAGRLCVSILREGVFCRGAGIWRRAPFFTGDAERAPVQIASDSKGRMWLNFEDHLVQIENRTRKVFAGREGLDVGSIEVVVAAGEDLYAGGDFGLARLDGNRFRTLRAER